MEFRQVIEKRRTTRQFTSEPVSRETVERYPALPDCIHWNKW